ncbi:MAG TPA: hypothetical protein VFX49_11725 [Chloroflexota bacterium]|nr:hypothetical protein [Chloroflexota bacterium]
MTPSQVSSVRAELERELGAPEPLWARALRTRRCSCGDCIACEIQTFRVRVAERRYREREAQRLARKKR